VRDRSIHQAIAAATAAAADDSLSPAGHAAAFRHAPVPAAVVTTDGRVVAANTALQLLVGLDPAALSRGGLARMLPPDDAEAVLAFLAGPANAGDAERLEHQLVGAGGQELCVALHARRLPTSGDALVLCQLIDLTEQRRVESLLVQRASHDPLTGLATRAVFFDQLGRALSRLPRTVDRPVRPPVQRRPGAGRGGESDARASRPRNVR